MRVRRHTPRRFDWAQWIRRQLARADWRALPRRRQLALWAAGAVTAFVGGYLIAALLLFPAPIFAATIVVPRLMGLTQANATQTLARLQLTVGAVDTMRHPTAARGDVVWQDPPPGVAVSERAAVRFTVSGGPQRIPVPDLVGYDQALASRLIQAAGLRIRAVDSTQAPVPAGVVVNTRPPADDVLSPGSGVTLVVSVGAPTIPVPDIVGLTPDDAAAVLGLVGLSLGTSVPRASSTEDPGRIIEQNPEAGTLSAPGTAVNITVARRRGR